MKEGGSLRRVRSRPRPVELPYPKGSSAAASEKMEFQYFSRTLKTVLKNVLGKKREGP